MQARLDVRDAGAMIAGRYRVVRPIAQGGMGEVVEAIDQASGARVAVKVLRRDVVADREAIARFRREGDILASLRHPNIVAVPHAGTTPDGALYLVMEMLDGETLGARMRRERQLPPGALVPTVAQTADALAAAHDAGVIHRDLKPDNVFLSRTPGGAEIVKLLDFGVSKLAAEEERLTRTGELLGTPRYMAPEQVSGERDLDGRVDVYSLGVILYEAIAGRPPFLGSTTGDLVIAILSGKPAPLRTLAPLIDPAVEAVVLRAISKARDARYATPTALADAFAQATGVVVRSSFVGDAPAVRPGMGTLMLGGGVEAPMPLAARTELLEPASEPDALRPGTLSAFSAIAPIETPSLPQLSAPHGSGATHEPAAGAHMPPTRATPMAGYAGPSVAQESAPATAQGRAGTSQRPLDRTGNGRPSVARDAGAVRVQAMPAVDARAMMAASKRPKSAKKRRSLLLPAAIVGLLLGALVATALVVVVLLRKPAAAPPTTTVAPEDRAATVGASTPSPAPGDVPAMPPADVAPTMPAAPIAPVAPTASPAVPQAPVPPGSAAPPPPTPVGVAPAPPPSAPTPVTPTPSTTRRGTSTTPRQTEIRLPTGGGRRPRLPGPGLPTISFP
ncbi:MAG: protein kinase [Deltaproteobacteria bacterium]|nr:protein kinase [Deltaproteobacteria bacterium]